MTLGHGVVETPAFMPVGTHATVKAVDSEDLRRLGVELVLANAYHLWMAPGEDVVAAAGGGADPAIVAPFARIIHVGLALLEQGAVTDERIGTFHIGQGCVRGLDASLVAIRPFDDQAFLLEQAFLIGHQLRQSLERRGGFQHQLLHVQASVF